MRRTARLAGETSMIVARAHEVALRWRHHRTLAVDMPEHTLAIEFDELRTVRRTTSRPVVVVKANGTLCQPGAGNGAPPMIRAWTPGPLRNLGRASSISRD